MLTDTKCREAKAAAKPYKLSDSGGLYLFVTPAGFKSWRWKYRVAKREKTAVRSGSLRHAEWPEFEDLETASPIWRIPPTKMKLDLVQKQQEAYEFIVPLAPAAVEIVKLARQFSSNSAYLFPNLRNPRKPMSQNTLSIAYRRLPAFSSRHVPHGWRSTFSTIMNEEAERLRRPGDRAVIDLMLAHKPSGVEAIYSRASFMPRRREIAEAWAVLLLEGLAPSSSLIVGRRH